MKEKYLKYPTFKSFLEALNKMDWTASTAHSITFGEGVYRVQKKFELDGIKVFTEFHGGLIAQRHHKSTPHSYILRVNHDSPKVFQDPPTQDSERVLKRGLKWLYGTHFSMIKNEKLQTFGVWHKDYYHSNSQFFPNESQFLGYFHAKNKEEVEKVLLQKNVDTQNWIIEPKPYDFGILKWTLLDLVLM